MRVRLVRPDQSHEREVLAYLDEMLAYSSSLDGCGGLEKGMTYADWLRFEERGRAAWGELYVPAEQYVAVDTESGSVLGMLSYRHPLSEGLLRAGGNIGYSVRPTARRQGVAKAMLALALKECKAYGEERVLVTCDRDNEASRRIILACGGVMENEIEEKSGMCPSGFVKRYWIDLTGKKDK